ncbi:MAG: M90 family metallopeptidase [Pseudomonadota bacterium]
MDTLPSALPLLGVTLTVALGALALFAQPWWTARRRDRLRAAPFPAAWRRILRRRVPAVARLPADLQRQLKRHIQVFVAEKAFIGCRGQAISDEVRITIAAQACLLLLGDARPDYYPRLQQILVYPDAFVVQHERPQGDGLVQVQRKALAGESWVQGQVILAWAEVLAGAADSGDGRNVVLHEFAHQVDQDSGVADGRPWRPSRALRRRWAAVMDAAFQSLQREPSDVIDAYGASDPAEYFAVVTELFFERPRALAGEAPAVYRELAELYRVHPLVW